MRKRKLPSWLLGLNAKKIRKSEELVTFRPDQQTNEHESKSEDANGADQNDRHSTLEIKSEEQLRIADTHEAANHEVSYEGDVAAVDAEKSNTTANSTTPNLRDSCQYGMGKFLNIYILP